MDNKIGTYRTIDTHGKSQIELILQVYDGAIAAYTSAKTAYEAGEMERGYELLEKAKKFITHLYTTLNSEKGGEIANNLEKIYSFILNETNVLEATKESAKFDDIIIILSNLRDGWSELRKMQIGEASAEEKKKEAKPLDSLSITA